MLPSKVEGRPPPKPYLENSNKYWRQAKHLLEGGELEKASELAWGSVAERVKALAQYSTLKILRSHQEVRSYIKQVANQLGDRQLAESFRKAESMHTNFYESHLDREDIRDAFLTIEELLARIDSLLAAK